MHRSASSGRLLLASTTVCLLIAAGCSGGGDSAGPSSTASLASTTSTTSSTMAPSAKGIVVMVSNDDGVSAPGIDSLVNALEKRSDVAEVVVVAPAENQSGAGDKTTTGATASPATTKSGVAATAVAGTPADSVTHGLDVVMAGSPPDLVMTGVNAGQNLGPVLSLSGTVGAARTAARRGIPAVAISQGLTAGGGDLDYTPGTTAAMAWLDEHIGSLQPGTVTNINAPTCGKGSIRGTVEEPSAAEGNALVAGVDCTATATGTDDVSAFNAGFVVVSDAGLA